MSLFSFFTFVFIPYNECHDFVYFRNLSEYNLVTLLGPRPNFQLGPKACIYEGSNLNNNDEQHEMYAGILIVFLGLLHLHMNSS